MYAVQIFARLSPKTGECRAPLHAALSDPCLPCGIDQTFLPPTAENDTTALLSYICDAAMVCHLAGIKSDTKAGDAGMCLPATMYTT